ncbi:unnamed protein product [Periconia digitata]|uniref:Polyketide synthase n=1 Tax=Periconia digitata TaxID=1303443 RepID=A0A9W4XNP5_9PLEO|nr:unnamed protein product [Periconia digitata]
MHSDTSPHRLKPLSDGILMWLMGKVPHRPRIRLIFSIDQSRLSTNIMGSISEVPVISKESSDGRHSVNRNGNCANDSPNGNHNGHKNETNWSDPNTSTRSDPNNMPIAICGMGMRLPGGVHTDSDLYELLIQMKDARSEVPKSRYNIDAYHNAYGKLGTVASRYGYFLDDVDLSKFDTTMFSMTPAEVSRLDPNQRLLLEVAREAFESAGESKFRGEKIGTYTAIYSEDWHELQTRDLNDHGPYMLSGKHDFMLGNRLSYEYDLKGPSMTLKTACSSAGIALHEALQAIRLGDIPSALVAGANLLISPTLSIVMSETLALSPDGSSKTFDAAADGYARAEGISCLYIKRLDHAIRDGNPVRAVIRASACNADGRTNGGLLEPNKIAHEALIRQTYANAGLDLRTTAMVECHGTGTAKGDPLEVAAVASCFGDHGVYIGSVKPNLGHSEGASAITSIMKAVLSLEQQTILPNIKFVNPNPKIPWAEAKLTVPTSPIAWPKSRCERMSVNSFGIGGSNVHFILDSARTHVESEEVQKSSGHLKKDVRRLLLFSANSQPSLAKSINQCQVYMETHVDDLDSVAYTLANRREHLKLRAFSVTNGTTPFEVVNCTESQTKRSAKVAFIFTGQGAQWIHMGRELIHDFPSFRESIRSIDEVLQSLDHAPSFSIEDLILHCKDKAVLKSPAISQPLCTALQIAVVQLLKAWGISPEGIVGHSSGEIAAAYTAGALSMREAIVVAYYRGFVFASPVEQRGGMTAVGLGRDVVEPYLVKGVSIACENSNKSVTISGDLLLLEKCIASIRRSYPDAPIRKLDVEIAYHTNHVRGAGEKYETLVRGLIKARAPHTLFVSSVHADVVRQNYDLGAQYWRQNLENPVLFHAAVNALLEECPQANIHLEIGPHSALAGPLRQIYAERGVPVNYLSVLRRGGNDTDAYLNALGRLYGAGVCLQPPIPAHAKVLPQFPTYPWHHETAYWSETRLMKSLRFRSHTAHDLLGSRTIESSDIEPTWRNVLRMADVPWLRDHVVGRDIVFPAAAYIAMAGEAVSQIQDNGDISYTVRNVHLENAMLLKDDEHTEIITTMRRQKLTARKDSDWYEFTIVSHNASGWTRHCHGLVTSGEVVSMLPLEAKTFVRKVNTDRWYKTMARIGLNYGPRFTGLRTITASTEARIASASVTDRQEESESAYALHPSTIDAIFQSWTVASTSGVYRKLTHLSLPTFIEELFVGNLSSANIDFVMSEEDNRAYSYGFVDGKPAFSLRGFEGTPLDTPSECKTNELQVQYLQWKPDFDFADPSTLMKPSYDMRSELAMLERLYVLCAIEGRKRLELVSPSKRHFEIFISWLDEQMQRFSQPDYPLVNDSAHLLTLDSTTRCHQIEESTATLRKAKARPFGEAIWKSYLHLSDIIEGRVDFLDLILQDNLLPQVYDWMNNLQDLTSMFPLLGNNYPQLRILEIGAGTGGLTHKILQCLESDFGERLYHGYTFTDISSGFFVQAQERFGDYEGMEYKVLDISKDPLEQGFEMGSYDLIVASNVLHATPCLVQTLTHCRKLLQPDGRLFLQELSPITKHANFVMGLFAGWWEGQDDGRKDEPFISPEEWNIRLCKAGFDGIESLMVDGERPYYMNANMIARPKFGHVYPDRISLLTGTDEPGQLVLATQKELEKRGYHVDHCIWGEGTPPPDQDLISFVDIEGRSTPILQDIDETDLQILLQTVDITSQSTLVWLSKPAQMLCQDPHAGQILGFARTVRAELAMDFATLELEHTGTGAAGVVADVLRKLQHARLVDVERELDSDLEYVWTDGAIRIGRFHWFPVEKALTETAVSHGLTAKRLVVGQRGMLQSLQWRNHELPALEPDEVLVQTCTVGMNFREVMCALGIIQIDSLDGRSGGLTTFGTEGVGRIVAVGSKVQSIKTGSRVMCMGSTSPAFATHVKRRADYCVEIPDRLSDEDAATMPIVYYTVLISLVERAHMQRGQSLLIHSAAGGVGIAAIHMARWLGLDIFVTTGTEEKANFLSTKMGVPRERIFASRNESFVSSIMAATGGRGVDVVLNSLSGGLLHSSWRCVAEHGHMVEIGRRDILGHAQLAMSPFGSNRTFSCVDASTTIADSPRTQRALQMIMDLYKRGHIHPINPVTIFEASRVEDAYRCLQQGLHVGKLVIRFPDPDVEEDSELALRPAPSIPDPIFRADASYLLVGGTGGLGKAIASWMVSHGARNLIFLSRSAGQRQEDQHIFAELKESSCRVQFYAGDVADEAVVQSLVKAAPFPIAGVMQMAMVLNDIGVMNMDLESWKATTHPKIAGTWNLHRLLPTELDFFVLFSSMAGLFGYFGQANYASANTFLDAFVQYRRAHGLVASVIDIGPIGDVGYVAVTPRQQTNITSHIYPATEQDLLDILQLAITTPPPRLALQRPNSFHNPCQYAQIPWSTLSITDPSNTSIWKRDPRTAIYRNLEQISATISGSETSNKIRYFMNTLVAEPHKLNDQASVDLLASAIGRRVSTFLMREGQDLDTSQSLSDLGVDSLVAIELRNWWKQSLGVDVSALELMGGGSLVQLGLLAVNRLKVKYCTDNSA